ncbi:unnamed protein product [Diamesa serratosioi]
MNGINYNECQVKFHQVLVELKSKQSFADDTFLMKFISFLSSDDYSNFVKDPVLIKWIEETASGFDSDQPANVQVASFTLKVLSMICDNEWQFAAIKDKGILEKIQHGIEKHKHLQNPSIKLCHIQLLKSISKHSIGLQWLKQTSSWKLCIKYYKNNHTVYIIREAGSFLFDILTKFVYQMHDESLCIEIIETILDPLINNDWKPSETTLIVDDEDTQRMLTPTINICIHLLTLCIESSSRSRISYYIILKYRFERNLWLIGDLSSQNQDFIGVLCRAHVTANFARLCTMDIPATDTTAKDITFNEFTIHFYNQMNFAIVRRCFKHVTTVTELYHVLWWKLGSRAPNEVVLENQDIQFGDQVIMLQMLPILYVIKSRVGANAEYLNEICTKMFKMSCEHTIRLLYTYRDALQMVDNKDNVSDLAAKSIQGILTLKNSLHRDRAILAFQILIYVLAGYIDDNDREESADKKTADTRLLLQTQNLLSALINGLHDLIKNYTISWKECVESTTIVGFMLVLLDNPNLSARLSVEALKLIQICIEHFLAPNLALLMDTLVGSGIESLGPTIYKRLHDNSWEVRDSTLELLNSIVDISKKKFPAFQKHILEHHICEIVEIIAKNDTESYVRASALKCLNSMISIKLFWEHALNSMDLKKFLVELLGTESEGVVRREAVACITTIYSDQQIPKLCLDSIFSVLAHCAVNDFYWEVKVNALVFWRKVMCRQFQHQGMIDGTFPAVTFSKEHKKIITLTEKEINLRLKKVLNELSLRGCLGVLLACLKDDGDLEVVRSTVAIVEKTMVYLNKYNYMDEHLKIQATAKDAEKESIGKLPVIDSNYSEFIQAGTKNSSVRNNADFSATTNVSVSAENGELCKTSDQVIEGIINSNDLGLLSDTYKKNLNLEDCTVPCELGKIDENLFKKFALTTSDDFLNYVTKTDLKKLIEEKSEWISHTEGFSTLLDDIILSFTSTDDANDMDCY